MKKGKKDRKELTAGLISDDNVGVSVNRSTGNDPRILALVRFLARRAAERDFAQLVAMSSNPLQQVE